MRRLFRSRFFRSFLFYVPYAVLSAMTFPAIFYATGEVIPSVIGAAAAILLAYLNLPLIVVALAASGVALLAGLLF